jgi:ABC-2 type transport system permease protein
MNNTMIHHLVRKDLRMMSTPVLCYFIAGLVAVAMLAMENKAAFYGGMVLMISALVTLSVHPPVNSLCHERKEGTLAFIMSLPISPRDYLWSKLIFNLLTFFVPSIVLMLITWALFAWQAAIPDGMIPFVVILFAAIGTNAVLILAVAVVTESLEKTIVTMAACNLAFHAVFYAAANLDAMQKHIGGPVAVWDGTVFAFLAAFAVIVAATLAATVWLQARKTDFL